jgi:hypothetical protein
VNVFERHTGTVKLTVELKVRTRKFVELLKNVRARVDDVLFGREK